MTTRRELAERACREPIDLSPAARKAFADRQARMIECHRWYDDEDFFRAYNTAVQLADELERLRAESLNALVERAAGELPEGFEIVVRVEREGASVDLENEDFDGVDTGPVDLDETMAEAFLRLMETAKEAEARKKE